MSTHAVLPLKGFAESAKTRLASDLALGPRKALVEAMFIDVLTALRRTAPISRIVVVSTDHNAQQIAGGHGAAVVEDAGSGHSDAALTGIADAVEHGATRVLLVPGDCPMLDPAELTDLLALAVEDPSVIVIPDRHGDGTNALVLSPPEMISPAFGPGSHARHRQLATAQGAGAHTVNVPSLGLDVDTPEDLAALQETLAHTRGNAAHTRGMLNQLARTRG